MVKMKKLFFILTVAVFTTASFAQDIRSSYDDSQGTFERVTERGPYLTNKFFDNWYLSVAGGVNFYIGDGDAKGPFGKRLAPALDVSLGKWITPSVGVRFQYAGLQAKGFSAYQTPYTTAARGDDGWFEKKFDLYNIHMDFMWNISNAIGGYKETRTWDFVPYAGFGIARSYKSSGGHNNQVAATVGLLNKIRLSGVVDLNLEVKNMFVKANFDQYVNRAHIDAMLTATVGVTVKFGPKKGFKRPMAVAPADYTPYERRINTLEDEIDGQKKAIDRLNKELEAARKRPPAEKPAAKAVENPATTIFFTIGSTKVSDQEMVNIENYAKFIKANPDNTFQITGYADNTTGSAQINDKLSRQRAENVADILVTRFGIDRSKLKVDHKGGTGEFGAPALCRIVKID